MIAYPLADPSSSTPSAPKSAASNVAEPISSRVRKRGKDELLDDQELAPSSKLSPEEQSPRVKRAKIQASSAEGLRRTRRTPRPASHDASAATASDSGLGSRGLDIETPVPNIADLEGNAGDGFNQYAFGAMPTDEEAPLSLSRLQLRNQSLPVLDNFVSRKAASVFHRLIMLGNTNTERDRRKLLSRDV